MTALKRSSTRDQRATIVSGMLAFIIIVVLLQLWLLTATMNAFLAGQDAVITPAAWTERIVQEADYVFVLAGDREQDRRKGRWPPWMEACDLIRESGVFQRLGASFYAGSDGRLELLVRKQRRSR